MRTAEDILDEHCTTTYNKHNGEEKIESLKSAVVIAMEDYAEQQCKQLHIGSVSNSFISVGERTPPKNTELLVQSPEGRYYLASWREVYSIFTCQSKSEDSLDWVWREI